MRFIAIPGYESIKTRLLYIAQHNQVPHAQLFWGPEGSAQLTLAWAFATYLNCHHKLANDACGECDSCLKMDKLIHPDVKFVFPTSMAKHGMDKTIGSNKLLRTWRAFLQENPYGDIHDWSYQAGSEHKQLTISREEARQIIQHISLTPFDGTYKIVFIWLLEYLHLAAANALLKVLEEPTQHTIFLLISVAPEHILNTIRSRVQPIYVPIFSDQAIMRLLTQQYTLATEQLTQIITLASGNMNKAYKLVFDAQDNYLGRFKTWMRACYAQDFTQLVNQAEIFQQLPREGQQHFLTYALHMLRTTLVASLKQDSLSRGTQEEQNFTTKLGKSLAYAQIKTFSTWLNQALYYLSRHANPKILFLDLSLNMASNF